VDKGCKAQGIKSPKSTNKIDREGLSYYTTSDKELIMSMFRKKPVIIEAFQFGAGDYKSAVTEEFHRAINFFDQESHRAYIQTLEGNMKVNDGDWVIKGVNGEFYLCKPDIFEKTYDLAIEGQ